MKRSENRLGKPGKNTHPTMTGGGLQRCMWRCTQRCCRDARKSVSTKQKQPQLVCVCFRPKGRLYNDCRTSSSALFKLSCVPASIHSPVRVVAVSSPHFRYCLLTSVISNSPRAEGGSVLIISKQRPS